MNADQATAIVQLLTGTIEGEGIRDPQGSRRGAQRQPG